MIFHHLVVLLAVVLLLPSCRSGSQEAAKETDPFRQQSCRECHRKIHPELITDLERSIHEHFKVKCEDCHGDDHDQIFGVDGMVSPKQCAAACHVKELKEFEKGAHSKKMNPAKRAALVKYARQAGSCFFSAGCHKTNREHADGSVGSCSVCHPAHAFSALDGKRPEVCVSCHRGPDNPEVWAWEQSKHGILYASRGLASGTATCATCHMPGGDHDDDKGLTHGVLTRVGDPVPTVLKAVNKEDFDRERKHMLKICLRCHGSKLSRKTLRLADELRREGWLRLEEAAGIIRDLHEKKVLSPMPKERAPNPITRHALSLGVKQVFDEQCSEVERRYYEMFLFHYMSSWRAAYHNDPELLWWYDHERLKSDLIFIRNEAHRLLKQAASSE